MNKLLLLKGNQHLIIDLLHDECRGCILRNGVPYKNLECPIFKDSRRIAYVQGNDYEIFACSADAKTTANFKKELRAFDEMVPYVKKHYYELERNAIKRSERRYQQLAHNLKSINAHCIQELYMILPSAYSKNVRESILQTKEALRTHLDQAAISVFHLEKFFSMMKVEFLVYERMLNDKVELSPDLYKIRDVVMKTLHMFFSDFTDKSVYVNIDENYDKVLLDYESVATALYFIIENATKYIKPSSNLDIHFIKKEKTYEIQFQMYSFYLSPKDREHIFEEGYSGEMAVQTKTNGHGIGMYRAKRLLTQCGADIVFNAGEKMTRSGKDYAYNVITITLPI